MPKHLPTVLTKDEARQVIGHSWGVRRLAAKLLYGRGLCLMDDPGAGAAFTNEQIKVRFEFGVCIVNWRPFVGYMT